MERLKRLYELRIRVEYLERELRLLRDRIGLISSSSMPSIPTGNYMPKSPVESMVLNLMEIEERYAKEVLRLYEEIDRVLLLIDAIPNQTYKQILMLRYLCGLTISEIASTLHYTPRWIKQLHKRAIKEFTLIHCKSPFI